MNSEKFEFKNVWIRKLWIRKLLNSETLNSETFEFGNFELGNFEFGKFEFGNFEFGKLWIRKFWIWKFWIWKCMALFGFRTAETKSQRAWRIHQSMLDLSNARFLSSHNGLRITQSRLYDSVHHQVSVGYTLT